jgi:hypothetical protein
MFAYYGIGIPEMFVQSFIAGIVVGIAMVFAGVWMVTPRRSIRAAQMSEVEQLRAEVQRLREEIDRMAKQAGNPSSNGITAREPH